MTSGAGHSGARACGPLCGIIGRLHMQKTAGLSGTKRTPCAKGRMKRSPDSLEEITVVGGEGGNCVHMCVHVSDTCDHMCETGGGISEGLSARSIHVCAVECVHVNAYVQI